MTDETGLAADDLLPNPSMRCAIGEHHKCLFADAGCPCSCHRTAAQRWFAARLSSPATVEAVARAIHANWCHDGPECLHPSGCHADGNAMEDADVALAVVRGLLGGTGGESA